MVCVFFYTACVEQNVFIQQTSCFNSEKKRKIIKKTFGLIKTEPKTYILPSNNKIVKHTDSNKKKLILKLYRHIKRAFYPDKENV